MPFTIHRTKISLTNRVPPRWGVARHRLDGADSLISSNPSSSAKNSRYPFGYPRQFRDIALPSLVCCIIRRTRKGGAADCLGRCRTMKKAGSRSVSRLTFLQQHDIVIMPRYTGGFSRNFCIICQVKKRREFL